MRSANLLLGLSLAYLGRKGAAVRQGERGLELMTLPTDALSDPYLEHLLVRITSSWASTTKRSTTSSPGRRDAGAQS
jgi:hypothetical protein